MGGGFRGIAPFVIGYFFLQHEDLGFELVPLVEDVPQLLEGEARPVGVFQVEGAFLFCRVLLRLPLVAGRKNCRSVSSSK